MKKYLLLLAALTVAGQAQAFGENGRWSSGWGQGVSEYVVVSGKTQLYIACSNYDELASVTLTVNGRDYGMDPNPPFDLIVDGKILSAFYNTSSHVGSNNFNYGWAAIRKAKTLQVRPQGGKLINLPVQGASKVLPAAGSKGFSCRTAM